jgi:hypothetical protein
MYDIGSFSIEYAIDGAISIFKYNLDDIPRSVYFPDFK